MNSTISHCMSCGFLGSGKDFCIGIACKTFVVRQYGELLKFGDNIYRFEPKVGSSLNPINFFDRDYEAIVDYLYPYLNDMLSRGVK